MVAVFALVNAVLGLLHAKRIARVWPEHKSNHAAQNERALRDLVIDIRKAVAAALAARVARRLVRRNRPRTRRAVTLAVRFLLVQRLNHAALHLH